MQLTCPSCAVRYAVSTDGWPSAVGADGELALKPRKVRCRLCQEVWLAQPQEDVLELTDPLPPVRASGISLAAPAARAAEESWNGPAARAAESWNGPAARAAEARAFVEEEAEQQRRAGVASAPPSRRRWPWVVLLLVAAGSAALWLVRGQLPAIELPAIDRPALAMPAIDLPAIEFPAITLPRIPMPRVALPMAPVPPLSIETEATIRRLPDGRTIWDIGGTIANPTDRSQPVPAVEISLLDRSGAVVGRWTVPPAAARLEPGARVRFETSAIDPPAGAGRLQARLKPGSLARF